MIYPTLLIGLVSLGKDLNMKILYLLWNNYYLTKKLHSDLNLAYYKNEIFNKKNIL